MEVEIWKDIPGYEKCYQVSNFGQVRSLDRIVLVQNRKERLLKGHILAPAQGRTSPYFQVQLSTRNNTRHFLIHRLVASAFLPDWNSALEVNHKDGNKLNNRADNLEMCTRKENYRHAIEQNLKRDYGENHAHAKLTNEEACQIRLLHYLWGIRQVELAGMFGVCKQAICNIVNNKTYVR